MLVEWALQPGSVVFRHGQGIAVAAANLSRRDRVAVAGPPDDVVVAVREALAELGASCSRRTRLPRDASTRPNR